MARELNDIIRQQGRRPETSVRDNGTELTLNAILGWVDETASGSTTSRSANRNGMASPKASTPGCATSG
jgi:hypothetical protein